MKPMILQQIYEDEYPVEVQSSQETYKNWDVFQFFTVDQPNLEQNRGQANPPILMLAAALNLILAIKVNGTGEALAFLADLRRCQHRVPLLDLLRKTCLQRTRKTAPNLRYELAICKPCSAMVD